MLTSEVLQSFGDEIEKRALSTNPFIKGGRSIATRIVLAAIIGLGAAAHASNITDDIAEAKRKRIFPEAKKEFQKDPQSAKKLREEIAVKYPEISVVSTEKQLKAVKNMNPIRRFIVGLTVPVEDNAVYSPSKVSPVVVLPKKINRYVLGHELGHHESFKEKQGLGFWEKLYRSTIEPEYKEEVRAWEKSPYAKGKGEKVIKDIALATYKTQDDADRIARNIGIGIGVPVLALSNIDIAEDTAKKILKVVKKIKK